MARKNKKTRVILEDVELKPQVIGYTYQKKSNLGRVAFIFVAFILVVYYINDISVFINNLIKKETAESIENLVENEENTNNTDKDSLKNDIEYHMYSNNLIINEDEMTLNNFGYNTNMLTFDITNNSSTKLNLASKKYFIETYNENKTLLERFKIDIKTISENSKISFNLEITNNFTYIALVEKRIDDYPVVNLENNDEGIATLSCLKGIDSIVYTFIDNELTSIKHTINDSNINDANYYVRYNSYQSKMNSYNNIAGMTATFNGTLNGYTSVVDIDLANANLSTVSESYYYGYKEEPKVVKFEMQTYGFTCE